MARVEQSYPTPIQGISTLAARNRAKGQAALQENMRSDPVAKLTRRPSLTWDRQFSGTSGDDVLHNYTSYFRDGDDLELIVKGNVNVTNLGGVNGYVNGNLVLLEGLENDMRPYLDSPDIRTTTVNGKTFIVNPHVTVRRDTLTDEDTIQKVVHINILSALSYSTTLTIGIEDSGGLDLGVYTYVIGDGSDGEVHDAERATNAVAENLAIMINTGNLQDGSTGPYDPAATFGMIAKSKGSTLSIQRLDNTVFPKTFVSTGRLDDVAHIPETVPDAEGLPKFAIIGTRITVKPDPTKVSGTHYLEAVSIDDSVSTDLSEVVWAEARSPLEPYGFDVTTLPIQAEFDLTTMGLETLNLTRGWEERRSGDDKSCPPPAFVDNKLTAVGQFQKRLVLVSGNNVSMSKTDQLEDWWKQSAVTLLATDPVEISSNAPNIDMIRHIIEHNKDLMLVASNGQFKIDGSVGVTPQTVAMPLTTKQEVQVAVEPVPLGTAVYLPIPYGASTGIAKYSGERDQQDLAEPLTHHVIGYMLGEAKILVGSPNLEMLAMTTTQGGDNVIYIYEQFTDSGKTMQRSWSKWILPVGPKIVAMAFRRDKLTVITQEGVSALRSKSLNMYSRVAINTHEVYLDDLLVLDTDGVTVTLPFGYSTPELKVVMGEGTIYPLNEVGYTILGSVITFTENIGAGTVYVGSSFTSSYQPTRPFVQDAEGITVTTDRLRVSRFILNVVDTEKVKMHIESSFYDIPDQEVSPRILGGLTNRLGIVDLYTGDYTYSYAQDADLATATFYTEGFLGMTIAGISWLGQYNKSSTRLP